MGDTAKNAGAAAGTFAAEAGAAAGTFAAEAGAFIGEAGTDFAEKFFNAIALKSGFTEESAAYLLKDKAKELFKQGRTSLGFSKDGLMLVDITDESNPKAWIASTKDTTMGVSPSAWKYKVYEIGVNKDGTPKDEYTEWVWLGSVRPGSEEVRQLYNSKKEKLDDWTASAFTSNFSEAKTDAQTNAKKAEAEKAAAEKAAAEALLAKQDKFDAYLNSYNNNTAKNLSPTVKAELAKHTNFKADFDAFLKATGLAAPEEGADEQKYHAFTSYIKDAVANKTLTAEEIKAMPFLQSYLPEGVKLEAAKTAETPKPEENKDFDLMGMLKDLSPIAKIGIGIAMFFGPQLAVTVAKWILPEGVGKVLDTISESSIAKFVTHGTGWALIADGGASMVSNLWNKKEVNETGSSVIASTVETVQETVADPSKAPDWLKGAASLVGIEMGESSKVTPPAAGVKQPASAAVSP